MENKIKGTKLTSSADIRSISLRGKRFSFEKPCIMCILNVNSDSFYSGSRVDEHSILQFAQKHVDEGALFLDLGASTSKPGSPISDAEEEWKRLKPALEIVRKAFPEIYISIDTYHSSVARNAVELGADLINDISAGSIDNKMFDIIAELQVPYVLMHMQGVPETMQQNPNYIDVTKEVIEHLMRNVHALKSKGVEDVIIDPGFGFGKTLDQNYQLFNDLDAFSIFEKSLLIGISRKSMITRLFDCNANEALNGSTVLHTIAIQNGANILRVHDVKPAMEAIRIVSKLNEVQSLR
jgi:dihydropteroate synthase